jgi:exosome complex component RRP4
MITLIKRYTRCRMFVGQNGRIWVDGDPADMMIAVATIEKIDAEAQIVGLTDSIREFLQGHYGSDEVVE